jgi:4'-phosphopantetheinyl transferase EntD
MAERVRVRPFPGWDDHWLAWADLAGSWTPADLVPDERPLLEHIPEGRRRREFVAGRMAARAALARFVDAPWAVLRSDEGAPLPHGPEAERALLSISHSRSAAVALVGPAQAGGLGIDLMEAADGPRIQRVLGRFQSPDEALRLRGPEGPFVAWGAREAVAKATRTGMFRFAMFRVNVTDFDPRTGRVEVGRPGMRLRWWAFAGHHAVAATASSEAIRRARSEAQAG